MAHMGVIVPLFGAACCQQGRLARAEATLRISESMMKA